MARYRYGLWIAVLALALTGPGMAATAEMTWTSSELDLEEGETVDLSDLADGESRTFGAGENTFTATRDGDKVVLKQEGGGEDRKIELTCDLGADDCKVITIGPEGGRFGLIIQKSGGCLGGKDCHAFVHSIDVEETDGKMMIIKTGDCAGSADCMKTADVYIHGDHDGHALVRIEDLEEKIHGIADAFFVTTSDEAGAILRCPEGDTTMQIDEEDADEVFLCPMHSVPLEKVSGEKRIHKIMIRSAEDKKN